MELPFLMLFGFLACFVHGVSGLDSILNETVMELALISARLSAIVYYKNPPPDGFDEFQVFLLEPDQAIVAKKGTYCYIAFRGTTFAPGDGEQNSASGREQVCDKATGTQCCTTPSGFFQAYNNSFRLEMETRLYKCVDETCPTSRDCVVITGNSQGGGIANVASLFLSDLKPFVFPYGSAPALSDPCPLVVPEKWFRFINTRASAVRGILYDPVPFGRLYYGMRHYGYQMIMSDDPSSVALIGLNGRQRFSPHDRTLNAHRMETGYPDTNPSPGYYQRVQIIVDYYRNTSNTFFVSTDGFGKGYACSQDVECRSRSCQFQRGYKRCV